MTRLCLLLACVATGCVLAAPSTPSSAPPSGSSAAGGSETSTSTASTPDLPDEFIVSFRPSTQWSALTRETIPHGWPQDLELRTSREVGYDPGSGLLSIGAEAQATGRTNSLRAKASGSVQVVWVPDYVSARACPGARSGESLLLVVPRNALRKFAVQPGSDGYIAADAPVIVFAAVPVQADCTKLSDPQWVAEHSAGWRPTATQKRKYRVLAGGDASARGRTSHLLAASRAQLEGYYSSPPATRGLADIDFQAHAAIAIGEGAPRVQYVHADAIRSERVAIVDVPLTTSACRQQQSADLSRLVYLADDTGYEAGRYRIDGSPLFVRPSDDLRHELRMQNCSTLFPMWRLSTKHFAPNPSMYLQLYGPTPRKERKYEDQIVMTPTVTEAGDTLNVSIPLQAPIPCPSSGTSKQAMTEAYMIRRAVLRRRVVMPHHNGPIRLVTDPSIPYGDVEWNLDARPCSKPSGR